jgi:hypothetical protein
LCRYDEAGVGGDASDAENVAALNAGDAEIGVGLYTLSSVDRMA